VVERGWEGSIGLKAAVKAESFEAVNSGVVYAFLNSFLKWAGIWREERIGVGAWRVVSVAGVDDCVGGVGDTEGLPCYKRSKENKKVLRREAKRGEEKKGGRKEKKKKKEKERKEKKEKERKDTLSEME
jgi:hypothetical protein